MKYNTLAILIVLIFCAPRLLASGQALEIKNRGTKLAYIARNGKPLLAFGCHLEHMFLKDSHPDYQVWSDWAQAHGVNHCRVRVIQPKIGDQYKPYPPARGGRYDLTRFDHAFWDRFRAICVNLRDHGIVMHLLIFPHNSHVRSANWRESLFNPDHNVNAATNHLRGSNHYKFWHSVADEQTGLWRIQKAAVEKIVEHTADLDNVYYDLSHEFRTDCCGAQPTDWNKAKQFFDTVADTIRRKYAELEPGKTPLIGLDAEHFAKSGQRGWNFSNPAFDLMILGNSTKSPVPSVETVISWREKYKKPFLLQEGGADDDHGGKIGISYHNTDRTIVRKYVWKWMMAKNQLIDIYQKKLADGYPHNYDPTGHSAFEDDALVLRAFWNTLTDYENLDYVGRIASGPGFRKMVLSSTREAVAYMASEMGQIGTKYDAQAMTLADLALANGAYAVDIWKPVASGGLVRTGKRMVRGGSVTVRLPAFTDDLVVHFHRAAANRATRQRRTQNTAYDSPEEEATAPDSVQTGVPAARQLDFWTSTTFAAFGSADTAGSTNAPKTVRMRENRVMTSPFLLHWNVSRAHTLPFLRGAQSEPVGRKRYNLLPANRLTLVGQQIPVGRVSSICWQLMSIRLQVQTQAENQSRKNGDWLRAEEPLIARKNRKGRSVPVPVFATGRTVARRWSPSRVGRYRGLSVIGCRPQSGMG